jgi:hypothetical protein
MVETMHEIVFTSIRVIVQAINYLFVSVDEVTTLDNHQWICVHVYVMKDWHRFSILFTLECVEVNFIIDNIISILFKCMVKYKGVLDEEFVSCGYA